MTTAACTSWQGLYVQRFFLGALESGVSPGWMLVVGGYATAPPADKLLVQLTDLETAGTKSKSKLFAWVCGTR